MATLTETLDAFKDTQTQLFAAINAEIQQLADAIAGGADAVAQVENAKARIEQMTDEAQTQLDALKADDAPSA